MAIHIILGFGLLIFALVIVLAAIKKKIKAWILPAWCGLISILLAAASGALFVDQQKDIYSFFMSVFFITAVVSYVWGIVKTK